MPATDPLLARHAHREGPLLTLWSEIALPLGRVHEFCGRARRTLALEAAAAALRLSQGPVIWIAPRWGAEPLNPDGMMPILPPQRVVFLAPRRPDDLLWSMEEALRSGAAPVVVADLPEPPGMTPVRRLHLAAETGSRIAGRAPLGLILSSGEGGAAGIETRYGMEPAHAPGHESWRLTRLRARMAPPKSWVLRDGQLLSEADAAQAALPDSVAAE